MTEPQILGIVARWRDLKEEERRVKEKLERMKPELANVLGELDALPVRINQHDRGQWVIKRIRQDRREVDFDAAFNLLDSMDIADRYTQPTLTEAGLTLAIEDGVLSEEDVAQCLKGVQVAYCTIQFVKDAIDEDAPAQVSRI